MYIVSIPIHVRGKREYIGIVQKNKTCELLLRHTINCLIDIVCVIHQGELVGKKLLLVLYCAERINVLDSYKQ
jgi:hypothetical protein